MRNDSDSGRVRQGAYAALLLCCLAYITTTFLRNCPGIISGDLQSSFGIGAAEVALFSAATLFAYGVIQLPSGIITDILGGRKTITLFTALAGLATLGFALAPNVSIGVAARFITGLALAAVPPACAVLAAYFPAKRYTFAVGMLFSSGVVGTILATEPLARGSRAFGWRASLVFAGVVIVALAVLLWVRMKEAPAGALAADRERKSVKDKIRAILPNLKQVLSSRHFWVLALFYTGASIVMFSFYTQWGAQLLIKGFGLQQVEASRVLLMASVLAMVAVPPLTSLADRYSRRAVMVACAAGGMCSFIIFMLFTGKLGTVALTALVTVFSVGSNTCASCVFSLAQTNFPAHLTGTATGCLNAIWPMVASALNVLFGAMLESRTAAITAGQAFDAQTATVQAFSETLILYVAGWALSLTVGILFIRNKFTVK